MKGAWFLAFCCTIAALPGTNSQERRCLVYTNEPFESAVAIVHKHLDYKRLGQSDRTYAEGVMRSAPSDDADETTEISGIDALRKRLNEQEEQERRKRSTGDASELPINMNFGDMLEIFN